MEHRHDTADHVLCVVSDESLKAPTPRSNATPRSSRPPGKRPGFVLFVVVKPCRFPTLSDHIRRRAVRRAEDAARVRFRAGPARGRHGACRRTAAVRVARSARPRRDAASLASRRDRAAAVGAGSAGGHGSAGRRPASRVTGATSADHTPVGGDPRPRRTATPLGVTAPSVAGGSCWSLAGLFALAVLVFPVLVLAGVVDRTLRSGADGRCDRRDGRRPVRRPAVAAVGSPSRPRGRAVDAGHSHP